MTVPHVRICESCDFGYALNAPVCPHCGCTADLSHTEPRETECLDLEVYRDYFLCKFEHSGEFQLFPGSAPLDVRAISRILTRRTVVTFNGNNYDIPILTLACNGATNEQIKQASDAIIVQGLRSWQFYDNYRLERPDWIDHIDLIEVSPGQYGLKAYGGKMHSRRIQDLPIAPSASIAWHDRVLLREYCGNDLTTTRDLFNTLRDQLSLRNDMTAKYGIDLRSKSDAQIAEALFKQQLPLRVERPNIPVGTVIRYVPPPWLSFQTPLLQHVMQTIMAAEFVIGTNGSPGLPDALAALDIRIGQSQYTLQIGGLHSCEKSVSRFTTSTSRLRDVDVASFYPNLILNLGLYPQQIGPAFAEIFRTWVVDRLADKARAGDKSLQAEVRSRAKSDADGGKTKVNGTFGKTGSVWSILYAPDMMLAVTLGGQLSLLMLIEMLELCGISVVSANTDGVVIDCPVQLEPLRDSVCDWWQAATRLELEATEYRSVHSRDVNSYIAIKTDGSVKLKGAYAPPKIVGPSWPNPTCEICTDAAVAFLRDGTPVEQTIRACRDVRLFVSVRNAKGGGEWVRRVGPPVDAGVRAKQAALAAAGWTRCGDARGNTWSLDGRTLGLHEAYATLITVTDRTYLGKVCRWYYAEDDAATCIQYVGSGNLVAGTDGSRPAMTLPDTLPDDIDYARYIQIAKGILRDVGAIT